MQKETERENTKEDKAERDKHREREIDRQRERKRTNEIQNTDSERDQEADRDRQTYRNWYDLCCTCTQPFKRLILLTAIPVLPANPPYYVASRPKKVSTLYSRS